MALDSNVPIRGLQTGRLHKSLFAAMISDSLDRPRMNIDKIHSSSFPSVNLNAAAHELAQAIIADAAELKIAVRQNALGTTLIDCGIDVPGSMDAGRRLAEICMAGLGRVQIVPEMPNWNLTPCVAIQTDHPVAACMASQYAGWKIEGHKFFAMGSGPMRAAGSKDPLFNKIGHRERPERVVGVMETRKFPPDAVCAHLAEACDVRPENIVLLVAPTASIAGTVQIVARSIETAMHKLIDYSFDLKLIERGSGIAPLPPVAKSDIAAIGRTNDAILYGASVKLWARSDGRWPQIAAYVPSDTSPAYGEPFADIFERHGGDFYAIDPLLFSPAMVEFHDLETGEVSAHGKLGTDILRRSFELNS